MIRRTAFFGFAAFLVLFLAAVTFGPTPVQAASAEHAATAEHPAGGEAAHGDAHGGGHGPSSQSIWDFIYRAMNFAVVVIVLVVLLRKPLAKFFGERRSNIRKTLYDFEKQRAQAEAKYKELEAKLAELGQERDRIAADFVRQGEDEREKIIANAKVMAEQIRKQALATIDQEIKAAKRELIREVAEQSAAMAEILIQKNITEADQKRLVEEYLSKVVRH